MVSRWACKVINAQLFAFFNGDFKNVIGDAQKITHFSTYNSKGDVDTICENNFSCS